MEYKCYKYKKGILLIDMIIEEKFSNINLGDFIVPEENVEEDYWQVPYMEQYFDVNSNNKICETYDEPDDYQFPTRVLFFIYESSGKVLTTPYGNVELITELKVPKDIKKEIDFESID